MIKEDYDPLKGQVNLHKADLVPFKEVEDYGVHQDKRKGVCVNAEIPLHVSGDIFVGPGDNHLLALPVIVYPNCEECLVSNGAYVPPWSLASILLSGGLFDVEYILNKQPQGTKIFKGGS